MKTGLARRQFLGGGAALFLGACAPAHGKRGASSTAAQAAHGAEARALERTPREVARLEAALGGRVGFYAIDTGSGAALAYRADERFAMCSTFKWLLAAAILKEVDAGERALTERVRFDESALLEYAPVAREHLAQGALSLEELAEAIVVVSDNTAANLLLKELGGPVALTRYARSLGDPVTRLDRTEPSLNTNILGDVRDTTSPRRMAELMRAVLCGAALSSSSRERLTGWLRASATGLSRLRAGLPPDWVVGDKTGSGERSAVNDVAFALPPGRAPILIAVYLSEGSAPFDQLEAGHAELARLVAREL